MLRLDQLMQLRDETINGIKRSVDDSEYLDIANTTLGLLNQSDPLDQVSIQSMGIIVDISNILYNNSDRTILPLDDGIYDMLIERYKKYNPNYQIGAPEVSMKMEGEDSSNHHEIIQPIWFMNKKKQEDSLFINEKNLLRKPNFEPCLYGAYPRNTGATISREVLNMPHNYPKLVGTLDKCKFVLDKQAIERGVYDTPNVAIFERDFLAKHLQMGLINMSDPITLVLELKYDGISVEADVTDEIKSARSRGDTNNDMAKDLTPILKGMKFPKAPHIEEPFGMKFEAIITKSNLARMSKFKGVQYKNGRNGIIGLFGGSDAPDYRDFITLIPLETSIEGIDRITEIEFMNKYYQHGEYLRYAVATGTYTQVLFQVYKFVQEAEYIRPMINFMYDGVVVSYADPVIRDALGRENFVNKYSIAIKFDPLKKQTVFIGYTFTIGQNGVITPMINYSPVEFYGTIHPNSSGHSYARFMSLGLRVGDIIDVEYVNDVMPYVTKPDNEHNRNNQNPIVEFPKVCPVCGAPVMITESGKSAYCTNGNCPGRIAMQMSNMMDKLGFKDISDERCKTLGFKSMTDLFNMSQEYIVEKLGAVGESLVEQIKAFKNTPQYDYKIIGAIGFSDIAAETWKKILNKISIKDIIELSEDILFNRLVEIKGIGPQTAGTVCADRETLYNDLVWIAQAQNVICTLGSKEQKKIRFTGVRDQQLCEYLNSIGFDANGDAGVTKTTDILIVPAAGFTSAKTAKAGPSTIIVDIDSFKTDIWRYLS